MLTSEQAFDLLPIVADAYDKSDLDQWRKSYDFENKSQEEVGVDLFKFLMKKASSIKDEIFSIVSVLDGKTADEIKAQSIVETMKSLKEFAQDPEISSFFKSAVK